MGGIAQFGKLMYLREVRKFHTWIDWLNEKDSFISHVVKCDDVRFCLHWKLRIEIGTVSVVDVSCGHTTICDSRIACGINVPFRSRKICILLVRSKQMC